MAKKKKVVRRAWSKHDFRMLKAIAKDKKGANKIAKALKRTVGATRAMAVNHSTYLTLRTRTHYVGSSQGVSLRLMKGVYYRVGAFKGQPIQPQFLSCEGIGDL